MVLNVWIQRIKRKQLFKVNTEYCTFHMLLLQGHLRKIISPFVSCTKELGLLPGILQKGNLFCKAVQKSYICRLARDIKAVCPDHHC